MTTEQSTVTVGCAARSGSTAPDGGVARKDGTGRARARARGLVTCIADETGSATAEYAVVILAAVAFAGVLVAVMRSGEVQTILTDLVRGALSL